MVPITAAATAATRLLKKLREKITQCWKKKEKKKINIYIIKPIRFTSTRVEVLKKTRKGYRRSFQSNWLWEKPHGARPRMRFVIVGNVNERGRKKKNFHVKM